MEIPFRQVLLFFVVLVSSHNPKSNLFCSADPTDGFTEVPLTDANIELQRRYNIPLEDRYSFVDGVRKLWVYADDKPHDPNSLTQPRTEVRITVILEPLYGDTFSPDGFTEVPLTDANIELQRPYNIPLEERYSFVDGVRKLWVYADDKPHDPNSLTQPRTEVQITGLDYSSGVWQFEGYGFVPNGTSGATIAQIHGAAHGATTLILRIYDGDMRYYSGDLIATGLYDRWFRLNIIHDVDGGKVTVFLDGNQVFQAADKGRGYLYFKCGVYAAPSNISYYMELRWRDIKIYKKY